MIAISFSASYVRWRELSIEPIGCSFSIEPCAETTALGSLVMLLEVNSNWRCERIVFGLFASFQQWDDHIIIQTPEF